MDQPQQPEQQDTPEQRAERMNAVDGSYAQVEDAQLTPEQRRQVQQLMAAQPRNQ